MPALWAPVKNLLITKTYWVADLRTLIAGDKWIIFPSFYTCVPPWEQELGVYRLGR